MQAFGDIDKARDAAGIPQKVLAERAGMRPQDYSRLKRPSRQGPTATTLTRLSKALGSLLAERAE